MSKRQASVIIALLALIAIALVAVIVSLVGAGSDDDAAPGAEESAASSPSPTAVEDPAKVLEKAGIDVIRPPPVPDAPESWGDYSRDGQWDGRLQVSANDAAVAVSGPSGDAFPATMNGCGELMYLVTFRSVSGPEGRRRTAGRRGRAGHGVGGTLVRVDARDELLHAEFRLRRLPGGQRYDGRRLHGAPIRAERWSAVARRSAAADPDGCSSSSPGACTGSCCAGTADVRRVLGRNAGARPLQRRQHQKPPTMLADPGGPAIPPVGERMWRLVRLERGVARGVHRPVRSGAAYRRLRPGRRDFRS